MPWAILLAQSIQFQCGVILCQTMDSSSEVSKVSIFHVFGGADNVCWSDWVLAKALHFLVTSHIGLTVK